MILSISQYARCSQVVGAVAKVCTDDGDYPDVWFNDPDHLEVHRHEPNGYALLTDTRGYCAYGWQSAHGALGAGPQGAALAKPTVTPIKKNKKTV